MSVNGIIMILGMNNTRLERKILIILDFENGFLTTYLPLCRSVIRAYLENLFSKINSRTWGTPVHVQLLESSELSTVNTLH